MASLIARLRERDARFIRFLVVGVFNMAFGYLVFASIYLATASHRVALVTATAVGVVFNFFTTGRIVFGSRDLRRLLPFVASYMVTLAINAALLEVLDYMGVMPLLGQVIALPIVVLTTYTINARLVFRR